MRESLGSTRLQPDRRQAERLRMEVVRIKAEAVASKQVRYSESGDFEYALAPNGERSLLTEKQWLEVRRESFKSWFGDWEKDPETASKFVDNNGEPQVLYHGTTRTFDTFSHEAPKTFDLENVTGAFFLTSDRNFAAEEYGKFKEDLIINTLRRFNEVFFDGQATEWHVLVDKWNEFVRSFGSDRVNSRTEVPDGQGGKYNWTMVTFDGKRIFPTDELAKIWDNTIPDHFEISDYETDTFGGRAILLPRNSKQILMKLFVNSRHPNVKEIVNEHDQAAMDNLFAHGMIERGIYRTDQEHILQGPEYGSKPDTDSVVVKFRNGQVGVAVFDPSQMKSAQKNSGAYNGRVNNIYQ